MLILTVLSRYGLFHEKGHTMWLGRKDMSLLHYTHSASKGKRLVKNTECFGVYFQDAHRIKKNEKLH